MVKLITYIIALCALLYVTPKALSAPSDLLVGLGLVGVLLIIAILLFLARVIRRK